MQKDGYYLAIPTKYYVIFGIIMFALFLGGLSLSRKRAMEMDYLTYEKSQDTILVEHPVVNRGSVIYYGDKVADANSILVENKDRFDDWSFRSKVDPSFHNLDDIRGSYYMYKAANNDTIVVIKDGYVLKFKMPQPDTVLRRERFWRD
jgi:hypothetical protein